MASARTLSRSLLRTRAFSSSAPTSSSSSWTPVLKPGTLPAYDEALSFLSSHADTVRSKASALDTTHASLSAEDKAALKESLEVAARINDPATLARFAASQPTTYDAADPVLRYLRERVWRNDSGVLAKLMQRCTLMHVFPDVLPGITPTADVQVAFGTGAGFTDHTAQGGDVLAGVFVPVQKTVQPPTVAVNVFHTEKKLYTVALVDPDQPHEENQSFTTRLLALKTNIELSAAECSVDMTSDMVAEYIPPHPQQGTKYRRYTTVLLEQSDRITVDAAPRDAFDLRAFAQANRLTPAGIHFWRAKWSEADAETVSMIYKQILKQDQPRYTRPPTLDKVRKQIGDIGSKWF
ncbi:PEBP-like protein [Moesziomyces antarcticus]|uniref:Related to MRPL35 - mitochondrial ribosomal protein, large subunit n=2 Tax=Pseudozyma antarctica TaxID=84753 RepID=A0A5C3FN23_PSEA2|nr:PEBP-like protein [Moesziomyces antarcticus]GAK64648.1 PEBP-like protein [Moesziomyces antarcticus]SPO45630.1 related to MRPL35 - mitochondrial ribosomal protein, large subunit [Moesziomyces antarcticus]